MTRAPSNNTLLTNVTTMKTALVEDWAGKSFLVDDVLIKIDDVTAEFADFIAEDAALAAAYRTYKTLFDAHTAKRKTEIKPRLATMRRFVIASYGPTNAKLTKYGITPRKKPIVPVKTKSDAQVKAKATREARGTVGPKQKKKIKGAVPAATPTTSAAGSAGTTAKQRRIR